MKTYEYKTPSGVIALLEQPSGTFYDRRTPLSVINALEKARESKKRIRLFYGDQTTGTPWLEENDVTGTVGRSSGPCKVPLLLHEKRAMGGGEILTHCVVAIMQDGQFTFKHPKFEPPQLTIQPSETKGYPWMVTQFSRPVANFKSRASAERWVLFMQGVRMSK